MTPADGAGLRVRGELCLLLARAFLPPTWDGARSAMAEILPGDLGEAATALGLDVGDALREFRLAMSRLAEQESLLVAYSHFFLSPPVPAPLNAGLYLDGSLDGTSVQAMEKCYRCHGVDRADRFKDLSDHLSLQLEFVAMLLGNAAEQVEHGDAGEARRLCDDAASFAGAYIRPWLEELAARTTEAAAAQGYPDPYAPLVRILERALGATAIAPWQVPAAARIAAG